MHLTLRGSNFLLSYTCFSSINFNGIAHDLLQENQTEKNSVQSHIQYSKSDYFMTVFCRNKFISLGSTSQDSTFAERPNRKKDSEEDTVSL